MKLSQHTSNFNQLSFFIVEISPYLSKYFD